MIDIKDVAIIFKTHYLNSAAFARLITIYYLKFSHLLAPVKLLLSHFPLNSLTHFSLVSFPLSAPPVIVFLGFCPQWSFRSSCSLWVISPTSMAVTTTKCLSSVQTEPKNSRYTSNPLLQISIGMPLKQLKISTSTLKSLPPQMCSFFWCPFLVNGITIDSWV